MRSAQAGVNVSMQSDEDVILNADRGDASDAAGTIRFQISTVTHAQVLNSGHFRVYDTLEIGASTEYITTDSAGNLVFADSVISAGEVRLSDLIGGGGLNMTNGSNNRVTTAVDSDTINAEANLTYDGTTLRCTDTIRADNNLDLRDGTTQVLRIETLGANAYFGTYTGYGIRFNVPQGQQITWGPTIDANTFLTVRNPDSTPVTSAMRILAASGGGVIFRVDETGPVYMPLLGDDDTEDHVVAIDDSTGLLSKRSVSSIGGVSISGTPVNNQIAIWTDASTIEGDSDVTWDNTTFAVNGNISIPWGDELVFDGATADYYIGGSGVAGIQVVADGGLKMTFTSTNVEIGSAIDLVPFGNKTSDIGVDGGFFDNAYFDRVYIDDTSTYIDISSGDMTFTDTNSGTVTLASLIGGGYWDESSAGDLIFANSSTDGIMLYYPESIKFGTDNVKIDGYSSTVGYIRFYAATGVEHLRIGGSGVWFYQPPLSSGHVDLGSNTNYFGEGHFDDTIWFNNINTTAGDYYLTYDSTSQQVRRGASTSDIRLKENIYPIESAVDKIMQLDGFTYNLNKQGQKETGLDDRLRAGLSAQDLQKVLPASVNNLGQTKFYNIDYNGVVALLVNGMKEQQEEIQHLKKQLRELKN
jgi:hypothetical protein